jgi:DNA repair ATPase RecN
MQENNPKYWEATDEERKLIAQFIENKPLHDAVKKHMLRNVSRQINIEEPLNHWIYTIDRSQGDEDFGRLVKMIAQAQAEVEDAFAHLEDLAKETEEKEVVNEAK